MANDLLDFGQQAARCHNPESVFVLLPGRRSISTMEASSGAHGLWWATIKVTRVIRSRETCAAVEQITSEETLPKHKGSSNGIEWCDESVWRTQIKYMAALLQLPPAMHASIRPSPCPKSELELWHVAGASTSWAVLSSIRCPLPPSVHLPQSPMDRACRTIPPSFRPAQPSRTLRNFHCCKSGSIYPMPLRWAPVATSQTCIREEGPGC